MKRLLAVMALVLAVALPGCAVLQSPGEIRVDETQPAAVQVVQKAINEANVYITAIANVVMQNVSDGTMTRAEGVGLLDKLTDYARRVDEAQALLDAGLVVEAKPKAETLRDVLLLLHREVAKQARKGAQ